MVFQFATESLPIRGLRLIDAIHPFVVRNRECVRGGIVRTQADCLSACCSPFLILSYIRVDCPRQVRMRDRRAGISLYPKLEGFFGLFQVPGDHLMEASCNEVLLRLARSVAEFVDRK